LSRKDSGWRAIIGLRRVLHAFDPIVPETILWVDPGESTGWAAWVTLPAVSNIDTVRTSFVRLGYDNIPTFFSGQLPWVAACEDLYSILWQFHRAVTVGWEDYLLTPGNRHHDPHALKVIGFLEWVTQRHSYLGEVQAPTVLTPQPSASRTLATTGNKLHRLGWYTPGERDSNAAAAHLLSYLLRAHRLPDDLLSRILPTETVPHGGC